LEQVLKKDIKWINASRALIHICDAPCHGKRFHYNLIDDFPEGDPKGLDISTLIRNIVKLNIDYYFCEINEDKTKTMIQEFNKEMDIAGIEFKNQN
jgi:hypothetical protein